MADVSTKETLLAIASRWGTPVYAYDLQSLRLQVEKLRSHLPTEVNVLYSLKSNASLGICDVLAGCGIGADVASAGELLTAIEAGFPSEQIFVAGPYKSPETISKLRSMPEAIISIDSLSELELLEREELVNRAVLRLRPDFGSAAVVTAGPDSRFGVLLEDLQQYREKFKSCGVKVVGFHIFAGSQVLSPDGVIGHLRGGLDLALRASDVLGITSEVINLGGGFGVPYGVGQDELDLTPIGEELSRLLERASPARFVLELGRYLVAPAGWYMTSVVGYQHYQNRSAVIVDGGTHQRADFCCLDLRHKAAPPLVLNGAVEPVSPTDVLGCLSLPEDVLAQSSMLPPLSRGTVLAFANAGAYGLWASATQFHGFPLPAEVAFDGKETYLMREPQSGRSILESQKHIILSRGCGERSKISPSLECVDP